LGSLGNLGINFLKSTYKQNVYICLDFASQNCQAMKSILIEGKKDRFSLTICILGFKSVFPKHSTTLDFVFRIFVNCHLFVLCFTFKTTNERHAPLDKFVVNIAAIVEGTACFSTYQYFGNIVKLATILDIETTFFIGPHAVPCRRL
jgi:hypothetical protein